MSASSRGIGTWSCGPALGAAGEVVAGGAVVGAIVVVVGQGGRVVVVVVLVVVTPGASVVEVVVVVGAAVTPGGNVVDVVVVVVVTGAHGRPGRAGGSVVVGSVVVVVGARVVVVGARVVVVEVEVVVVLDVVVGGAVDGPGTVVVVVVAPLAAEVGVVSSVPSWAWTTVDVAPRASAATATRSRGVMP
jgi:hypothetical protein